MPRPLSQFPQDMTTFPNTTESGVMVGDHMLVTTDLSGEAHLVCYSGLLEKIGIRFNRPGNWVALAGEELNSGCGLVGALNTDSSYESTGVIVHVCSGERREELPVVYIDGPIENLFFSSLYGGGVDIVANRGDGGVWYGVYDPANGITDQLEFDSSARVYDVGYGSIGMLENGTPQNVAVKASERETVTTATGEKEIIQTHSVERFRMPLGFSTIAAKMMVAGHPVVVALDPGGLVELQHFANGGQTVHRMPLLGDVGFMPESASLSRKEGLTVMRFQSGNEWLTIARVVSLSDFSSNWGVRSIPVADQRAEFNAGSYSSDISILIFSNPENSNYPNQTTVYAFNTQGNNPIPDGCEEIVKVIGSSQSYPQPGASPVRGEVKAMVVDQTSQGTALFLPADLVVSDRFCVAKTAGATNSPSKVPTALFSRSSTRQETQTRQRTHEPVTHTQTAGSTPGNTSGSGSRTMLWILLISVGVCVPCSIAAAVIHRRSQQAVTEEQLLTTTSPNSAVQNDTDSQADPSSAAWCAVGDVTCCAFGSR